MNYRLETERMDLRFVEAKDLMFIHDLYSLPESDQYNTLGIPANIDETKRLLGSYIGETEKNLIRRYTWKLTLKKSAHPVGLIALNLGMEKYQSGEVWFKIHSDHWGKGLATEALKVVIHFGFSKLNLHRIEAGCAVENGASIRVLEKAGMIQEGRKRQVLPLKSGWSDGYEYGILASEYNINVSI